MVAYSVISELGKQRMMDLSYKDWSEEFQATETPYIMRQIDRTWGWTLPMHLKNTGVITDACVHAHSHTKSINKI